MRQAESSSLLPQLSQTERIFFVEQQAAKYHAQLALLKLDSHGNCPLVNFPSENNNSPLTDLCLQPGQQGCDVLPGLVLTV